MTTRTTIDPQIQDLAQQLVNHEGRAGSSPGDMAPAFRVFEKLRRLLTVVIGVSGFRSLLLRAFTLAKAQVPELSDLRLMPDGTLEGFEASGGNGSGGPPAHNRAAAHLYFLAQFLDLLAAFIGKDLMLNLVLGAWPDFPVLDSKSPKKERP